MELFSYLVVQNSMEHETNVFGMMKNVRRVQGYSRGREYFDARTIGRNREKKRNNRGVF